jgi:hypothetical protein
MTANLAMRGTTSLLLFAMLACGSVSASAQSIESAYTTFDADKTCKHTPGTEPEDYGEWLCPGYGNIPVRLAAGDQRMLVTFGKKRKNDDDDLASSQTFPAFNDVYKGTVEWRLEKSANDKLRPFATILRWNVMVAGDHAGQSGGTKATGQALVVTRLGPGGVCHVGYVDARANPDANDLARKLADEHARTFKCGKDKRIVVGKSGDVGMPRDE